MSADIREQYDKIYRYCYFKVKNTTLAEDLTQETFLKYLERNSYVERGKRLAYLYTIARNLCNDTFRKSPTCELTDDISMGNPLEGTERALAVRQALEKLPQEQQELLLLRYANGLSVGEITSISGLSRFAVYRKTKTALSLLKELLRKEDFS